jgi:phenylacetate-CoA ligase
VEVGAMIWNPSQECMSRSELRTLQLERLRTTLDRVYERVPLYRRRFDEAGIRPQSIRSLEDVRHIPFLTKQDMRDSFPYGLFASPMKDVARLHASSGTTGRPTAVGYTRSDLEMWSEAMARLVVAAGVTGEDIAHIAFGYGLFTGAFGLHQALEKVGAAVLPVSSGNTQRQVEIMRYFGSTTLICTPSYALRIAEVIEQTGVPRGELSLRLGLFGAEPWTEGLRRELETRLGVVATDNYGLSELIGPGISGECQERNGMHINEDLFLAEIVDPETLEPLPEGSTGELILTSLAKEAFPVVRYRTRDITCISYEPCACGRTTARMQRVAGRTDDMLIVRGVNFFPSQVETVLLAIDGTEPHYQIVVSREGTMDEVEVQVEVSESLFADEAKKLYALRQNVAHKLRGVLGISVGVKLAEPGSIQRSEGKAKRVIDSRPKV